MFVTAQNCDKEKMMYSPPIELQHGSDIGRQSRYYNVPLLYEYMSEGNISVDDMVLEGCMMESLGIKQYLRPTNKTIHEITGKMFPIYNPDQSKFVDIVDKIHQRCGQFIDTVKREVGIRDFDVKRLSFFMPDLIKRRTNDATGEIIHNTPSAITMKLLPGNSENRSMFVDLDENEIPWDLLKNVNMRFIPIIRFKHINIVNGRATVRVELIRAVVTHISVPNRKYNQSKTITELKLKYPDISETMKRNLEYISKERTRPNSIAVISTPDPDIISGNVIPIFPLANMPINIPVNYI